jgi:D-lactate dehydrogenase
LKVRSSIFRSFDLKITQELSMATAVSSAKMPRSGLSSAELKQKLSAAIDPARILNRPIDVVAFASDASFYRLIPQAVIQPQGVEEIRALFRFSREHGIPLTFRGGGTSLSGQTVSDGLLVDVARYWRGCKVEEGGGKIRLQPGVLGGQANAALAPYGKKIGPDPASVAIASIGGILSNNSSGMSCGVVQNAYHTLESLTFVLPSGTVIDTASPDADEQFRLKEPELARTLLELKQRIEGNAALAARIRAKYKMKNTTGYSLNAFVDFERPVDIFRNLLIGAEGTLAFMAEAVLRTVPDLRVKYTGLLLFPDLHAAAAAIAPLREAGAAALELMDRASLRAIQDLPGIPPSIKDLGGEAAGILVEFQVAEELDRPLLEVKLQEAVANLTLLAPPAFTHDPSEQAQFWKIRAGLFPSVSMARASGTTMITEDLAYPVARLAEAAMDLTALFKKHHYDDVILYSHAKDGNIHFMMPQSFNEQSQVEKYSGLLEDVVEMTLRKYDGALKAEHGTGRNMTPFVQMEWGDEGYAIMQCLKQAVDPLGLLNPGVIINPERHSYIANLKRTPTIEPEVDKCIECGFCEPKCPSRDLSLTARQRIVVRREMQRMKEAGDQAGYAALDADFPYMALDTCAVDGLCATTCPVGIDTSKLTKHFRQLRHSAQEQKRAVSVARNFGATERLARLGLSLGHLGASLFGHATMASLTRGLRGVTGPVLPLWSKEMPRPRKGVLPVTTAAGAAAVYFPTCVSRVMGALPGDVTLMGALLNVAERAGVKLYVPEDAVGVCCGVPFSSKGFDPAHHEAINHAIERFWKWSGEGAIPVVVDTSPCSYGLLTARPHLTAENQARYDKLRIIDSIEFANDRLLPRLTVARKVHSVVLHPVCSVTKMGLTNKLVSVAAACSDQVTVPQSAGCCAFAGDRGFLFPELTESATKPEAAEVREGNYDGHYSSSRTCEVGMTRATGKVYRSFIHLLDFATKP